MPEMATGDLGYQIPTPMVHLADQHRCEDAARRTRTHTQNTHTQQHTHTDSSTYPQSPK